MLYHNATDIVMTNEGPLLPGEVIHEEGVALVWVKENGKSYLKLSTGVGNETFAGFAISRNMPAASGAQVEEFVIDSTGLFVISRLPIPSQLLVKIDGAIADQAASATAPTTAGDVSVSGAELRFAAADVGKKVFVQYAFELTVNESRSYTGDAPIGGLASNVVGQVGYIKLGNVSTNMFDAAADWAADDILHPRLAAGGRLTVGGTGTELKGAIIKQSPTTDRGFVTIEICGPGF